MIKNFDSTLIDKMINEIQGGKNESKKREEISEFTKQFYNDQLSKKCTNINIVDNPKNQSIYTQKLCYKVC